MPRICTGQLTLQISHRGITLWTPRARIRIRRCQTLRRPSRLGDKCCRLIGRFCRNLDIVPLKELPCPRGGIVDCQSSKVWVNVGHKVVDPLGEIGVEEGAGIGYADRQMFAEAHAFDGVVHADNVGAEVVDTGSVAGGCCARCDASGGEVVEKEFVPDSNLYHQYSARIRYMIAQAVHMLRR